MARVTGQYPVFPEGDQRLETGGGIKKALPLLGEGPFIVINADIWTDFPFDFSSERFSELAHIVLVPNPAHHPDGDFGLLGRRVVNQAECPSPTAASAYTALNSLPMPRAPSRCPAAAQCSRSGPGERHIVSGRMEGHGTPRISLSSGAAWSTASETSVRASDDSFSALSPIPRPTLQPIPPLPPDKTLAIVKSNPANGRSFLDLARRPVPAETSKTTES